MLNHTKKIKEIYEDKNSEYYDMFLEKRDIEKTISILKDLLKEEWLYSENRNKR